MLEFSGEIPLDYDLLAEEYARHRAVHPAVLTALCLTPGLGAASRVLEVGCGSGNYLAALESECGSRCWGLDPSDKMLANARERGVRAQWMRGQAERLGLPDASFDLVFTVDVIHHVADRAAYYREAYRVLAPGGRVCTATDSEEIIRRRLPMTEYFPETVEVDLARYPRIDGLCQLMSSAAFHGIEMNSVECALAMTDIRAYEQKAYSCLHLISDDAFERGIRKMREDVQRAPIPCVSRYVMLWGVK